MTTQSAPASDLWAQAKTGAGWALVGMSAAVLLWGGVVSAHRLTITEPMAIAAMKDVPLWSDAGDGDGPTTAWDAAAGIYRVAWEAPCPVKVTLNGWDGTEVTREVVLGVSRARATTLPFAEGGYFFSVEGRCDWRIGISRT
jgi:hypothetical protein